MPNHIKNRIELTGGNKERFAEFIEKYSTYHETAQHVSLSGDLTYHIVTKNGMEFGWLDPATNIFSRRNAPDVEGIPDGFEKHMEGAWVEFPDFNKIVPMPQIMVGYEPSCKIETAVKAKYRVQVSDNPLLAMLQCANREKVDFNFNESEQELFDLGCKIYEETGYVFWYDWSRDMWGTKWSAYDCTRESETAFTFVTAWSGVPKLIEKMANDFPDIELIYEFSDEDTGCNCGVYRACREGFIGGRLPDGSNEAYELALKLRPEQKQYYALVNGQYECNET